MFDLVKTIREALQNYEDRISLEIERAETWKTLALDTGKRLIETEKELAEYKAYKERKKIYSAPNHQRPIRFEELIYGKAK